jgi:hypothetical protein
MEVFVLNQGCGLYSDLVGAITNRNNLAIGNANVLTAIVLYQFLEVLGDPGFIT